MRGRLLTDDDRAGRPAVTVINETAARRFWPGDDPIGKHVWFSSNPGFTDPARPVEVVGVVADVKYWPIDEAVGPDFYTSYLQFTYPSSLYVVKTADAATVMPALRRAVAEIDPRCRSTTCSCSTSGSPRPWRGRGSPRRPPRSSRFRRRAGGDGRLRRDGVLGVGAARGAGAAARARRNAARPAARRPGPCGAARVGGRARRPRRRLLAAAIARQRALRHVASDRACWRSRSSRWAPSRWSPRPLPPGARA